MPPGGHTSINLHVHPLLFLPHPFYIRTPSSQAFPRSPKDALAFYLELFGEAEEKLTTVELSLLLKQAQTAQNSAKSRELAAQKKAQPAKKALPKGPRMGGALDTYGDDDSYDGYVEPYVEEAAAKIKGDASAGGLDTNGGP